ncbi:MAG: hypothetical protein SFU86_08470 [Pirellulaceae bacterium]|nr:hypothetical protein [Pirellulaceae bacterium]
MRRATLGILALFLLVLGFVIALRGPADGSAAGLAGGCVRVGLVLGAMWLAWPQILTLVTSAPRWLMGWFIKSKKPTGQPGEAAEPAKVRRPRRRSNT